MQLSHKSNSKRPSAVSHVSVTVDYAGRLCDASVKEISFGKSVSGDLQPDQSVYLEWKLNLQQILELPMIVELHATIESEGDVHPFLSAGINAFPSVATSSYRFLTERGHGGKSIHKIHTSALHQGNLTFGLFNIDFLVHNAFRCIQVLV